MQERRGTSPTVLLAVLVLLIYILPYELELVNINSPLKNKKKNSGAFCRHVRTPAVACRLHGGTRALLLAAKVTKTAGGFPTTPPGPPRRLLRSASNPSPRVRCKSMVRSQQALKNTGAPATLLLQSLARRMQARPFWCRGVLRKYSSGGLSPRAPCTGGLSAPQTPCSYHAMDSVYGNA